MKFLEIQTLAGVLTILLAVTFLMFDLLMPLGVAAGLLYIAAIIVSSWSPWKDHMYWLALIATALVITGYYLSEESSAHWIVLANRSMSIAAIWVTAYLLTLIGKKEIIERSIIETVADGIITIDESGIIQSFNPAAERVFAYTSAEIIGKNISSLMPSFYSEKHDKYIMNYLTTGEKKIIGLGRDVQGLRKDGSIFPMSLAVSETYTSNTRHFVGIVRDISIQKNTEENLRREHELSENLIHTARTIILVLDTNGGIVRFNRYMEEISGYALQEVQGRNWVELFITDEEQSQVKQAFARAMSNLGSQTNVNSIVTKNGEKRLIEWLDSPLTNVDGEKIGILTIGQDITERQETVEKLRLRTQQLLVLSELAQQAMSNFDADDLIDTAIQSVKNILPTKSVFYLKLQADKKYGKLFSDDKSVINTSEKSNVKISDNSLFAQTLKMTNPMVIEDYQNDTRFDKNIGINEQHLFSGLSVLVGTIERPYGILCAFSDQQHVIGDNDINFYWSVANILTITGERHFIEQQSRQLQKALANTSRISAIGKLAASVNHEINQPITAMINYVQSCRRLLRSKYEDIPEEIDTLIDKSVAEAERAAAIVRRLRDYTESGVIFKTREDINTLVEEAIEQIRHEINAMGISMTADLQFDLPQVSIDKIQIQQVIVSLLHNSIEAMEEVARRDMGVATRLIGDSTVEIIVWDTGPGVGPDIIASNFEMIASKKENGLGIGLSICKSILDEHEGEIFCSPTERDGAKFFIHLPLTFSTEDDNNE
jgi:PAS domain S-box-containing protein